MNLWVQISSNEQHGGLLHKYVPPTHPQFLFSNVINSFKIVDAYIVKQILKM